MEFGFDDQSVRAPMKAPPSRGGGGGGGSATRGGGGGGGGRGGGGGSGGDAQKSSEQIVAWVRSFPESHVPEKSKENICGIVENSSMRGNEFTDWVLKVPPDVCAPKHAMKLKAGWKNVLAEDAAKQVAAANLESNQKVQKATMLVC